MQQLGLGVTAEELGKAFGTPNNSPDDTAFFGRKRKRSLAGEGSVFASFYLYSVPSSVLQTHTVRIPETQPRRRRFGWFSFGSVPRLPLECFQSLQIPTSKSSLTREGSLVVCLALSLPCLLWCFQSFPNPHIEYPSPYAVHSFSKNVRPWPP